MPQPSNVISNVINLSSCNVSPSINLCTAETSRPIVMSSFSIYSSPEQWTITIKACCRSVHIEEKHVSKSTHWLSTRITPVSVFHVTAYHTTCSRQSNRNIEAQKHIITQHDYSSLIYVLFTLAIHWQYLYLLHTFIHGNTLLFSIVLTFSSVPPRLPPGIAEAPWAELQLLLRTTAPRAGHREVLPDAESVGAPGEGDSCDSCDS